MTITRHPYYAETLEQLAEKCGPDAEAALANVHWSAICTWLMHAPAKGALSNPMVAAIRSVGLARDHDRSRLCYPDHTGRRHRCPFADQTPEAKADALRLAAETRADWEKAGKPHLTRDRLKSEQQYVHACRAAAAKRLREAAV